MNRRGFIKKTVAGSVGGLFFSSSILTANGRNSLRYEKSEKSTFELALDERILSIVDSLSQQGHRNDSYLTGGCVVPYLNGKSPIFFTLLSSFKDFKKVKAGLFRLGVDPIPSPEWGTGAIRFLYQDALFVLIDSKIDVFCMLNELSRDRQNFIPFAHNFLSYNIQKSSLYDPYKAIECRNLDGRMELRMSKNPVDVAMALEYYFNGILDIEMFNLVPSYDFHCLSERVLSSNPSIIESKNIVKHVLNYMPELINTVNLDTCKKVLCSEIVKKSFAEEMSISSEQIWEFIQNRNSRDSRVDGRVIFEAVDMLRGYDKRLNATNIDKSLNHYILSRKINFKPVDLYVEYMKNS